MLCKHSQVNHFGLLLCLHYLTIPDFLFPSAISAFSPPKMYPRSYSFSHPEHVFQQSKAFCNNPASFYNLCDKFILCFSLLTNVLTWGKPFHHKTKRAPISNSNFVILQCEIHSFQWVNGMHIKHLNHI